MNFLKRHEHNGLHHYSDYLYELQTFSQQSLSTIEKKIIQFVNRDEMGKTQTMLGSSYKTSKNLWTILRKGQNVNFKQHACILKSLRGVNYFRDFLD